MDIELTKDSKKLIRTLYKSYLKKRKSGVAASEARDFGSSQVIHKQLLPDWKFEDVDDACRSLSQKGLLNCFWADNIAYFVSISTDGIVYMEKRFKNKLIKIVDFATKFIP